MCFPTLQITVWTDIYMSSLYEPRSKKARLELEEKTGRPVVSGSNFLPPKKASSSKSGKTSIGKGKKQ